MPYIRDYTATLCRLCGARLSVKFRPYCRECYNGVIVKEAREKWRASMRSKPRTCARCESEALAYSSYCGPCRSAYQRTRQARQQNGPRTPEQQWRRAARKTAWNAVRSGYILKPAKCSRCNGSAEEMHHSDYSKPLAIEWLCVDCHFKEHGRTRYSKRTPA